MGQCVSFVSFLVSKFQLGKMLWIKSFRSTVLSDVNDLVVSDTRRMINAEDCFQFFAIHECVQVLHHLHLNFLQPFDNHLHMYN